MVRFEVDVTKGAVLLLCVALALGAIAYVYAYGGGNPSVHGHDGGEIQVSCVDREHTCTNAKYCYVECNAGETVTGGGFVGVVGGADSMIDNSHPLSAVDWSSPYITNYPAQPAPTSGNDGWFMYDWYGDLEGNKKTYVYAVCCNFG